jgi:hypothetical protein
VSRCDRPIDPLDAEALAAGEAPTVLASASEHVRLCSGCADQVARASALLRSLDELGAVVLAEPLPGALEGPSLADSVLRIRPFSRRERRDFGLWRTPLILIAALLFSGLLIIALPGVTAREQAGLAAAALAPAAALLRAAVRSAVEMVSAFPSALEALGLVLRREVALGLACLLLLAPALWGFRRALARERGR